MWGVTSAVKSIRLSGASLRRCHGPPDLCRVTNTQKRVLKRFNCHTQPLAVSPGTRKSWKETLVGVTDPDVTKEDEILFPQERALSLYSNQQIIFPRRYSVFSSVCFQSGCQSNGRGLANLILSSRKSELDRRRKLRTWTSGPVSFSTFRVTSGGVFVFLEAASTVVSVWLMCGLVLFTVFAAPWSWICVGQVQVPLQERILPPQQSRRQRLHQ